MSSIDSEKWLVIYLGRDWRNFVHIVEVEIAYLPQTFMERIREAVRKNDPTETRRASGYTADIVGAHCIRRSENGVWSGVTLSRGWE